MAIFRVRISGANLVMDVDGEQGRYGFHVTRFVDARTSAEAADRALATVRGSDQVAKSARNEPEDPPSCWVDGVEALEPSQPMPPQQLGFAFYRQQ